MPTNFLPNDSTVIFENVHLKNGKTFPKLAFQPYEIRYKESSGRIELFTFTVNGQKHEYIYDEISRFNKTVEDSLGDLVLKLSGFGLSMAQDKFMKGNTGYHLFGALLSLGGRVALKNKDVERKIREEIHALRGEFKGYVEYAHSGNFLFDHPLYMRDGNELDNSHLQLWNLSEYVCKIELTNDDRNFESFTINPYSMIYFRFPQYSKDKRLKIYHNSRLNNEYTIGYYGSYALTFDDYRNKWDVK